MSRSPGRMKKLKPLKENLNAYTFYFDPSLLDELKESYRNELYDYLNHHSNSSLFHGNKVICQILNANYLMASYKEYPLLWLSSNSENSYQLFHRFFMQLAIESDLKELVDYHEQIVMYCGFFVIGNRAPYHHWHVDYQPGANAYTLITPLFSLSEEHGHLAYKIDKEHRDIYRYRSGEAIVFGDRFSHATEIYSPTNHLRILVSMTFGTDKLEYWEIIKKTVTNQSLYIIMPCGHVKDCCQCLEES